MALVVLSLAIGEARQGPYGPHVDTNAVGIIGDTLVSYKNVIGFSALVVDGTEYEITEGLKHRIRKGTPHEVIGDGSRELDAIDEVTKLKVGGFVSCEQRCCDEYNVHADEEVDFKRLGEVIKIMPNPLVRYCGLEQPCSNMFDEGIFISEFYPSGNPDLYLYQKNDDTEISWSYRCYPRVQQFENETEKHNLTSCACPEAFDCPNVTFSCYEPEDETSTESSSSDLSTAKTEDSSSDLSTGAIVGIVAASITVLGGVVYFYLWPATRQAKFQPNML